MSIFHLHANLIHLKCYLSALIEKDDGDATNTIDLELFDNGSGSDFVANDGIYSRYFTKYTNKTRYSVKCQIEGDDDTGFITQKEGTKSIAEMVQLETSRIFRSYPAQPSGTSPVCELPERHQSMFLWSLKMYSFLQVAEVHQGKM